MTQFLDTLLIVLTEIFSLYVLKRILVVLAMIYVITCVVLYIKQDSLLFFPQKPTTLPLDPSVERIDYDIDGVHLSGFIRRGEWPTIFYFGGNASEAYRGILSIGQSGTLIGFNYRGYGESSGSPSEKNLFADAIALYDRLEKDGILHQSKTILYGKSLGTGVVAYLSSLRPTKALILITPYDSLLAVAAGKYRFFPVKYLLRHRFDSVKYLTPYNNPLLIIYGGKDVVIPNRYTQNLIAHFQTWAQVQFFENAGHDDIISYPGVQSRVELFLHDISTATGSVRN